MPIKTKRQTQLPSALWAPSAIARLAFLMALVLPVFTISNSTHAQWIEAEDLVGPYVDGEPFDVIYLNKDGDDAIMKVQPLGDKLPQGEIPKTGQLIFEYFADNDDMLEVPFSSIKKIKTFKDLLLEEAEAWKTEGDYPKAFRNLLWIYDHGGRNDPEMVSSLKDLMFKDGVKNYKTGEFELALSIYEDIYQQTPNYKPEGFEGLELSQVVMSCFDGIINKQFDKEDYIGVRRTLAATIAKYGDASKTLEAKWTKKFVEKSNELLAEAKRYSDQGKGREAHLAAKQAEQMAPGRPEVFEAQKQILVKFPLVVVGVTQSTTDPSPSRIEHWGARRGGRLLQRTMVELDGLTDEGGRWSFLNGVILRADENGLKYTLEIKDEVTTFGVPKTTAYDVSSRLLAMAEQGSPVYNEGWAKICESTKIDDQNHVTVTLRSPYIRPEALMNVPYSDPGADGKPEPNGAYVLANEGDNFNTFELNPRYERRPNRQHPVIIEQLFKSGSTAVDELIAGNIDIVDRVPASDLDRLKVAPGVRVRSYVLPTVHMLVPKIRGELEKDSHFRQGLSFAIDRELLVKDIICGGKEIDGCEVISGPLPLGTEESDQISYGYDMTVRPLPFNSQLGMVLVQLSVRPKPPKQPEGIKIPTLVIAHPNSSTATNAAAAIARMWTEIGVETVTRKLKPGESIPPDDNWDFVYLEVTVEEPLSDAAKIVGLSGFAQQVSAPIEQTLQKLSYSDSWRGACSRLRTLHRQVAVDLAVLPLWQVKEHYAFRGTVKEIGRDLIHLYQNVDRWKIDLSAEEEQPKKR